MNNTSLKKKYVISSCGCDVLLPFALVYLFYIILHGHLSPTRHPPNSALLI